MKLASRQAATEQEQPERTSPGDGRPARPAERRDSSAAVTGTLARRWAVIAALALIGAVAGGFAATLVPDRYEASAFLLVSAEPDAGAAASATAYAQALTRIARQPAVLVDVPEEAEVDTFGQDITLTAAPDAPVIEVVGSADSPELATLRANAVSSTIEDYVAGQSSETGYDATIVTEAIVSGASLPSRTVPGVAAGLVVGAFVGVVIALAYPWRPRPDRRDGSSQRAGGTSEW